MLIRAVVDIAGASFLLRRGAMVDIADGLARSWIASGVAEPVREAAVAVTPERAMRERPRGRG